LPYPAVTDPEDPPLRPERHIPNSIATMRRRLIIAIVHRLPRWVGKLDCFRTSGLQ
jgi:hypothetical protein